MAAATIFTFDGNCDLVDSSDGEIAEGDFDGFFQLNFFPASDNGITGAAVTCNIVDEELECDDLTFFVISINSDYLYIGSYVPPGASVITLTAVPVG